MSPKRQLSIAISLIALFALGCQSNSPKEFKNLSPEEVAVEIMASSGTCTLITLDSTGQPRARIMDPFPPEDDFVIWFGTNLKSRKVGEIISNSRTTVNYYDKEAGAYVSLYGRSEVIADQALLEKHWKPEWQAFYPNYPEGYGLIRFTPTYLELISEKHGFTGDPVTWKPTTINL